ncbi:saccharopine dehydrogenase family protein [Govanella unica]|uniref:Saccharopine dehydrogenase family protein n=1 Tax=Govanella unica TaxID=2975056 RepID=A0A9X3TWS8_9PROT|nr:saccharopine dehydrogenase family protein [Govania unica]MDA5193181.1 saccharopine dehydrogenase family protein [Govania unica]
MTQILLLGAGKIGAMIAELLSLSGDYEVTVGDHDLVGLNRMNVNSAVRLLQLDVTDKAALADAMAGKYAVLSACPYHLTPYIARAAKAAGVHYFDLTEDVESTRLVKELAKDSATAFVPQCGLAPGFISIVAYDLAKKFEKLHNVHMRVGALPKYPSNALMYNLTWSTDGLINEYCNPCEAVVDGVLREVPPLEEKEHFSLDGVDYEAFNTSGGLGTLCETLEGKVNNLNYRTVRYPGHCDIMRMLIRDLRLGERRGVLKDMFEYALPVTYQDVVLIFVTVSGYRQGRFLQETYAHKVYAKDLYGQIWSAIQITTASGICTMLDLLRLGKLPQKGFVRQEDCDFRDFIANRFGANYARPEDAMVVTGQKQEKVA